MYVGQTCRTLDHRLKEHSRALASGNLAQSAIAEHAAQESHVIDWKEAKVVYTHPRYHQRCALESWRIRSETTTMNRHDGNLPQAYNSLLSYPREPHTSHLTLDHIQYFPVHINTIIIIIITIIIIIIIIITHYTHPRSLTPNPHSHPCFFPAVSPRSRLCI